MPQSMKLSVSDIFAKGLVYKPKYRSEKKEKNIQR